MARIQDKKRILYVDTDSADHDMPNGACRSILNSRTLSTIDGAKGVSENVRQNLLVANPNLPEGTNTCIGTFPDNTSNTIIYCYHNSELNHSIFRYYPSENDRIDTIVIDPKLGFDKNSLITSIDLVDDLMYWTDNNQSPRKINLTKANNAGKNFVNNVYFPNALLNNTIVYTIYLSNDTGVIAIGTLNGSSQTNLEGISKDFARQFNINEVLRLLVTAETCGISTSLTTNLAESNLGISVTAVVGTTSYTLKVIADNYYPTDFKEEFIERIKYPLDCQPSVLVKRDPNQKLNLIQDKTFQFRTQVVYDDYEKSVWSAISEVSVNPEFSNKIEKNNPYNYVEVDYNTDRINDDGSLSIIRGINIAVREGNLGLFKLVTQLSKAQFISSSNIYKFYNDGVYTVIDQAESNKPYDAVGLLVQAQKFANNRLFDGGITEGYDNVCVDSELSIDYSPDVTLNNISGVVFIRNPFMDLLSYSAHQPIHQGFSTNIATAPIVFGGFGKSSLVDRDGQNYAQKIPLGGFVFYLAGTPYRGISQQYVLTNGNIPLGTGQLGLFQNKNSGVYSSEAGTPGGTEDRLTGLRNLIEGDDNYLGGTALDSVGSINYGATLVYSVFNIPNVPAGKYVMRIASHSTTQPDLDNPLRPYEKTSTTTLSVGGIIGSECELEVKSNGDIVIGSTTYPKGTKIGNSAVADLTDPTLDGTSTVIKGFVCDKDFPAYTGKDILNDTRIELSKATLSTSNTGNASYNSIVSTYQLTWASRTSFTDHNGYFFYAASTTNFAMTINVSQITSGIYALTPSAINFNGSVWSAVAYGTAATGIFRNTNDDVQSYARTKIGGIALYQDAGLIDVSVILAKGKVVKTDNSGTYSLYAYVNTKLSPAQSVRNDNIYYLLFDGSTATFTPSYDTINIEISALGAPQTNFVSPYSGKYNGIAANALQTVGVEITGLNEGLATQSLKRGGKYLLGQVYFDQADRKNFVGTSEQLNLRIPFYTEILTGSSTIVGGGDPIISWSIKNLPPTWATHYQWVRTLNTNQGRYLQWTINTETSTDDLPLYIDDKGVKSTQTLGTQIVINIENITTYATANPDSKVSYQFEEGDRMVFIKDGSENFYNNYYDFKIKGLYKGNALRVIIDNLPALGKITSGTLIEIYNPLKQSDTNIFYEMGECYPITENASGVKIHEGSTINQEYWTFTDNFFDGSNVGFTSEEGHDFQVNDVVYVTQDPGFVNSSYEGEATVIAITATTITIDKTFGAATPANPGNVVRYATGTFTTGDTWNRSRVIPFVAGSVAKTKIWAIEDASVSDFYESKVQSIGRANTINKEAGQLYRPSLIRFSNSYIQGSKVNGLSGFEALNEKILPFQYGLINRLCFSRDVIVAIFSDSEIVSMYLGKSILKDLGTTQLVAISDKIISDTYEYQGSLGTQHPESVDMDDDGNIFGFDSNKGVTWKRVANGLVPISEFDNRTYFKGKAESIGNTTWPVRVFGIHDRLFDQYIITFDFIRGNPDFTGLKTTTFTVGPAEATLTLPFQITDFPIYDNTFGFNAKENKWESFYTYFPEFYGKARNNVFVSFFNGQLYKHNVNALYNNFYGTQLPQRATVIGNVEPSVMKRYMNLSLETTQPWSAPSINTPTGQESELDETDFELIEGVYRADMLRDANTPNVQNPLIFGDDMIGETISVEIENSNPEYTKIYAINIYSIISEPTNK